jgi:hypothetical protein
MARGWLILAVLAACYDAPDYRRTHFACKQLPTQCPSGMRCDDDHCVVPSPDSVIIDEAFAITRDAATLILDRAAGAAYCRFHALRLATDAELHAAAGAGIAGPGTRCTRGLD